MYGQANPTFSGSIVGLKNSDPITASYATTATAPSPVGAYAIVPTAIDSTPLPKLANYQVTLVNGTLDGGQGGADASRRRQSRRPTVEENPALTFSVEGLVDGDTRVRR